MKRMIWITTEFEAYHRWKDAPEEVKFLRDMHRHIFKVKVTIEVWHNDREIEFIMFKWKVRQFIKDNFEMKEDVGSCEMIGEKILEYLENEYPNRYIQVEVSEDGENGAVVVNR